MDNKNVQINFVSFIGLLSHYVKIKIKIIVLQAGSRGTKTVKSFMNTKGHEKSLHTEQKERNHLGFPDACDKGPESLIFKEVPPDEKSKGVAGNIKVR